MSTYLITESVDFFKMGSDSQSCSLILSHLEPLLLEQRELWPAEEGWLTFDLTATSNLWLDSPEQNLGLHLVLEDSRGQTFTPRGSCGHIKMKRRFFCCKPAAETPAGFMTSVSVAAGQRRKPQLAGLVTGSRPQNKQPFMVAFFRADGGRFRSIRSAHGHKGRHSKGPKPQRTVQDAMRAVEAAKGPWKHRSVNGSLVERK